MAFRLWLDLIESVVGCGYGGQHVQWHRKRPIYIEIDEDETKNEIKLYEEVYRGQARETRLRLHSSSIIMIHK